MKIFIDQGHNYSGEDTGAQGNGLKEQDITYSIGIKLGDILKANGIEIKYSREKITDNVGTTLNSSLLGRCTKANTWGADYFISLHCDSSTSSTPSGSHICIYSKGGKAEQLAKLIQDNLLILGLDGRSEQISVRPDLSVLKNTAMSAVLVEMGFISNKDNSYILANKQDELAQSIAKGVLKYLGIELIKSKPNTENKVETTNTTKDIVKSEYKFNWMPSMNIIEIDPLKFGISIQNKPKRNIGITNFFNLDFFANLNNGVTSASNLSDCGNILSNSKNIAGWINTSNKALTTLYVKNNGEIGIVKTNDISTISDLKTAVSGIPIYPKVSMEDIKKEGYFGNELYDTYHSFLGIRNGKLIYIAAKCGFNTMASIFQGLGCSHGIKVDGGGSFILVVNGEIVSSTDGNRVINAIGMFE